MSADGSYTCLWADAEHRFRLPIGQLRELQRLAGAGPPVIFNRLLGQTWMVDDVRETIRLGLIGGGMAPTDALRKVILYIDNRPLMENVSTALAILGAALLGEPDDQPASGKGETEEHTEATDGSASPNFTAQGPSWDGMHEPSIN